MCSKAHAQRLLELLRKQKVDDLGAPEEEEKKHSSHARSAGAEKCAHLWSSRWLAVKNVDHAQLGLMQAGRYGEIWGEM